MLAQDASRGLRRIDTENGIPNAPVDAVHILKNPWNREVFNLGTKDRTRESKVKRTRNAHVRIMRDGSEGWTMIQRARAVRVPPEMP